MEKVLHGKASFQRRSYQGSLPSPILSLPPVSSLRQWWNSLRMYAVEGRCEVGIWWDKIPDKSPPHLTSLSISSSVSPSHPISFTVRRDSVPAWDREWDEWGNDEMRDKEKVSGEVFPGVYTCPIYWSTRGKDWQEIPPHAHSLLSLAFLFLSYLLLSPFPLSNSWDKESER